MSETESMGSKFFSLPYDRDRCDSLEQLIGQEWDGPERDNDHAVRSVESPNRSLEDNRTAYVSTEKINDSKDRIINSTPARYTDLIVFDAANDFRSCGNISIDNDVFLDYGRNAASDRDDKACNVEFGSCDNFAVSNCNLDSNQRDVNVRNRRNCSDSNHFNAAEEKYRQFIAPCYDCSDRCSSSLPPHFDDCKNRSQCGSNGYGSLPGGDDMPSTDHPLTYCVHGKPGSGCCATLLNQPTAPTINISIEEHCHVKERDTGVNKKARRQIIVVSLLCLFFMIAEAVGGYLSGSLAIATDAAHLLTDFAGFMISLFALYVAARKPSRAMPFGWHRAEVIGAMISVLTIWLVTGILVYLAVMRLIQQDFEIDATVMLITSAIGVVVNIIMALTLHQHSHVHTACGGGGSCGGGTRTDQEAARSPEKQNINVRAAFIHIIGDLLQSVGVFIAATIIYYKPEYNIVDPICTFMFSVLVLMTTFNIMKDALLVLMEGIPRDVDYNEVLSTLLAIDGVMRVHNLRIWALSLDKTALSAHLAIAPGADCTEILKAASKAIHKKYNFFEMTLQIEYFQQNMETCVQCQVP